MHAASIDVPRTETVDHGENDATLRHAANILGFVDEATRQRAKHRSFAEQHAYDKAVSMLRDAFGNDELLILMAAGKGWSEEQAATEALAI